MYENGLLHLMFYFAYIASLLESQRLAQPEPSVHKRNYPIPARMNASLQQQSGKLCHGFFCYL